jgi:tetratricopeptide (TPR) repeat protein
MKSVVLALIALSLTAQAPTEPTKTAPVRFSQFDAYPRVIEQAEAEPVLNVYQNSVWADVTVGTDGLVESVKVLKGNRAHFTSASNAFKKWRFRPFTVDGKPVRAVVERSILVPDHAPDRAVVAENAASRLATKCLTMVRDGSAVEAEATCRTALGTQRKLLGEENLEVEHLESSLGVSIFLQGRTREALGHLERALAISQKVRRPDDADLAGEYRLVGAVHVKLGEWKEADGSYGHAVETFEAALRTVPSLRPLYEKHLRTALLEHAAVKRALGEGYAAAACEKKATDIDSTGRPLLDVKKSGADVTIRNDGAAKLELSKIITNDKCEYRFYEATVQGNRFERDRRGHWWSIDTKDRLLEGPKERMLTLEPGASTEVHLLTAGVQCGDPVSLEVCTTRGTTSFTCRPPNSILPLSY